MAEKLSRHVGLHAYRWQREPEEERFAKAWLQQNSGYRECRANTLAYLIGPGDHPASLTDRDCQVAATVVQWLGSPVGQSFLEELGYRKGRG